MFEPVLEVYFKIFFLIKKYNTVDSICLYIFIGIINYEKKIFLLYLIQFYTGF